MEGHEKKKGAEIMVPWVWIPVCLVIGAVVGFFIAACCEMSRVGNGQ